MVTWNNSRHQQNHVFVSTLCAIVPVASVSDYLILVLAGSENRPWGGLIFLMFGSSLKAKKRQEDEERKKGPG